MQNNYRYTLLLAVLVSFLTSQSLFSVAPRKPWTCLIYIAAANSLNEFAQVNIDQMKQVGSNANVNILVYLTVTDSHGKKTTVRLYIEPGKQTVIGHDVPMDSGARATFMQAVQWAIHDYPSDHLFIDMWDHGSGPLNRKPAWMRGICYDDTTGHFLTDLDFKYVFDQVVQQLGRKIDVIACDACLMADLEIAYALQGCANFLVASQETIPGAGFDYAGSFAKFKQGTVTPEILARAMLDSYDHEYEGNEDFTLSLIDLSKVAGLTQYHDQVSNMLTAFIRADKTGSMRKIVGRSAAGCLRFTEATYMDLFQFYRALVKNLTLMPLSNADRTTFGQALTNAQRAYNACILDNVHSQSRGTSTGMSIYFPDANEGIHGSYPLTYWGMHDTGWIPFLKAYLNVH